MGYLQFIFVSFFCFTISTTSGNTDLEQVTTDVIVYSANPAGIGAAISAANGNAKVLLLEPLTMIGGMGAAGGVGLMNQGCGPEGATGLGRVWGLLNGEAYGHNDTLNLFPAPSVMAESFWKMINATKGISVRLGCRLSSVKRGDGDCIQSAEFLCEKDTVVLLVNASIFIDATYDGDIMVGAGGIDYAHGREPRSAFNESLAGVIYLDESNESFDKQNLTVDATYANGTIIPGISTEPLPPEGTGDDRLMAFSYFACVTDNVTNSVPYPRPDGYNPDDFILLQRTIEAAVASGSYPNGPDLAWFSEYDAYSVPSSQGTKLLLCCGRGPVNCDQPDLNAGYATATYSQRLAIQEAHKRYLLGSLYYMANDPRVPSYTRNAIGRWGLCKDEYVEFGYWPPQIYVRISNRLRGEVLLTQNNIANPRSKPDSVSMGCWEFDQHTMSRRAVKDPKNPSLLIALNEGYMRYGIADPFLPCSHPDSGCQSKNTAGGNWYDVPFGVMLPVRGQASNLLIPVAISSTSIAYSSTRIEQMYMDLGTAAGIAAGLALQSGVKNGPGSCPNMALQDTKISAVQDILVNKYQQRIHGPIQ
jgi:hypothetical protein